MIDTTLENQETPPSNADRVIRIQPAEGWVDLKLDHLLEYRDLIYFLTLRDILLRYKQTILGAGWAILQPLFMMLIFSMVARLGKIPSDGIPHEIFIYSALVPWFFFANGIMQSSNSLVLNANLIKKVYFPRLAVPLASVTAGVVDFCLAFLVLLCMMPVFGVTPTMNIIWLPFLLVLAYVTSLGVGLWLSAMNVQFRDIRYTIPFLIQFWMFATPIFYPSSMIPEPWTILYAMNPMVGVIEGFRWAILGTDTAPGYMIIVSTVVAVSLLVSGAYYFRRLEKTFADVV